MEFGEENTESPESFQKRIDEKYHPANDQGVRLLKEKKGYRVDTNETQVGPAKEHIITDTDLDQLAQPKREQEEQEWRLKAK